MNVKILGWAGLAALFAAGAASAHHSYAMFDNQKTISVTGTVTDFEWVNPHSWIRIAAKGAKPGDPGVTWNVEASGVFSLKMAGWTRHSLKVGDTATLDIHPLHNGQPGGGLVRAVVNGATLNTRASTPE